MPVLGGGHFSNHRHVVCSLTAVAEKSGRSEKSKNACRCDEKREPTRNAHTDARRQHIACQQAQHCSPSSGSRGLRPRPKLLPFPARAATPLQCLTNQRMNGRPMLMVAVVAFVRLALQLQASDLVRPAVLSAIATRSIRRCKLRTVLAKQQGAQTLLRMSWFLHPYMCMPTAT